MDKGEQEKVTEPLFLAKETRALVHSFIKAYLSGDVKFHFPTKEDYEMYHGREPDEDIELVTKNVFTDCVAVAAGAKKATAAEIETAIEALFQWIVRARNSDRLEGDFLVTPELESRVLYLEERTSSVEKLLEELQNLIRIRGQSRS